MCHSVTMVSPKTVDKQYKPQQNGKQRKKNHRPGIPKADADLALAAEENVYLYMRSMSISGSFWYSFIFTVSERILFRFLKSSSTCGDRNQ